MMEPSPAMGVVREWVRSWWVTWRLGRQHRADLRCVSAEPVDDAHYYEVFRPVGSEQDDWGRYDI